jgi:hypothetical protein
MPLLLFKHEGDDDDIETKINHILSSNLEFYGDKNME